MLRKQAPPLCGCPVKSPRRHFTFFYRSTQPKYRGYTEEPTIFFLWQAGHGHGVRSRAAQMAEAERANRSVPAASASPGRPCCSVTAIFPMAVGSPAGRTYGHACGQAASPPRTRSPETRACAGRRPPEARAGAKIGSSRTKQKNPHRHGRASRISCRPAFTIRSTARFLLSANQTGCKRDRPLSAGHGSS